MIDRSDVERQLQYTLAGIEYPRLGQKIAGKVRDSFVLGQRRILIASDRLSAFDRILTTIPFKGQLLTQMAAYWFEATKDVVANHIIAYPHPNVLIAEQVSILPIEVVVRGYLTGSAWRDYLAGRAVSGIMLPRGMRKSERFSSPLITPSTKAEQGAHDEPISSEEIVKRGIVEESLWNDVCTTALRLFEVGTRVAAERGLILVDTKYEFGTRMTNGKVELVLADEVHTQDSSRYWIRTTFAERFAAGEDPEMLDKEFVRRHLIEQGYMGEGEPPVLDECFRVETALRYMEAFERITGKEFRAKVGPVAEEIGEVLSAYIGV